MAKKRTDLMTVARLLINVSDVHKCAAFVKYDESQVNLTIYDADNKKIGSATFDKDVVLVDVHNKKVPEGRHNLKGVRFDDATTKADNKPTNVVKKVVRTLGSSPIATFKRRSI